MRVFVKESVGFLEYFCYDFVSDATVGLGTKKVFEQRLENRLAQYNQLHIQNLNENLLLSFHRAW